jgi:iron complex transport system permease protein
MLALLACILLLVVTTIASLAIGSRPLDVGTVFDAITAPDSEQTDHMVVRDLRVPRTVIGLIAGLALALAGAIMQGLTRNPLADPGLLGVNAGASLFVIGAITVFGVSNASGYVWFAMAGAAIATVIVYVVGSGRNGPTPVTLTIAGAAVTAALTSIINLVLLTDIDTLNQYRFWSVGSLVGRDIDTVRSLAIFVVIGCVLAAALGRPLNALALGDDVAVGLGHNLVVTRALAALAIVVLCGSATAMAGPIVFVGLVIPHIARRLAGTDYRWILAFSALLGPSLLVLADIVGRLIVRPAELEAGLVVAFIGAPVMIALVRRARLGSL